MERWAKAAMCLSGTKVPMVAQTARRPRVARSAVATGTPPSTAYAPRAGSTATRRTSTRASVFVSRVSLNPRPTCWCCSEQERCIFGSAGNVSFELWFFAPLSACGEVESPPRAMRAQRFRILLPDRGAHAPSMGITATGATIHYAPYAG